MKKKFASTIDVSNILFNPMTTDEIIKEMNDNWSDHIVKVINMDVEYFADEHMLADIIDAKLSYDMEFAKIDYTIVGAYENTIVIEVTAYPPSAVDAIDQFIKTDYNIDDWDWFPTTNTTTTSISNPMLIAPSSSGVTVTPADSTFDLYHSDYEYYI